MTHFSYTLISPVFWFCLWQGLCSQFTAWPENHWPIQWTQPKTRRNSLSFVTWILLHFVLSPSTMYGILKSLAPHSSTLAWKIPWMEEPGRLQSMGSLRVGHDWVTLLSLFTFLHWKRKWQPTPVFLPGESQGRRAWWAAVYGVTQSRTRLKWLSSSSSSSKGKVSYFVTRRIWQKRARVCC